MSLRPTKVMKTLIEKRLAGESACPTSTKPHCAPTWGGRFRLPTLRARTGVFKGVTMGLLAHQK